MAISDDLITRSWYSEKYIDKIITPSLSTWRSRYDLKEDLLRADGKLVKRNMRTNDLIPKSTSADMEHIVTPAENCRPDIIAYNSYGDPRLAWVILAANGLSDYFDLVTNMRIIIPSSSGLYQTGGVLSR